MASEMRTKMEIIVHHQCSKHVSLKWKVQRFVLSVREVRAVTMPCSKAVVTASNVEAQKKVMPTVSLT